MYLQLQTTSCVMIRKTLCPAWLAQTMGCTTHRKLSGVGCDCLANEKIARRSAWVMRARVLQQSSLTDVRSANGRRRPTEASSLSRRRQTPNYATLCLIFRYSSSPFSSSRSLYYQRHSFSAALRVCPLLSPRANRSFSWLRRRRSAAITAFKSCALKKSDVSAQEHVCNQKTTPVAQ